MRADYLLTFLFIASHFEQFGGLEGRGVLRMSGVQKCCIGFSPSDIIII